MFATMSPNTQPPQHTPSVQPANPLAKYFRQPSLYITLPSLGKWYTQDQVKYDHVSDDGQYREVAIYPYTAMDEILLRSPDALLSGVAIVSTMKSCVPAFTDHWEILTCDVDKILIAMRIASYGPKMEIETTCPHCETNSNYEVDLASLLDTFRTIDYQPAQLSNGLTLHFRPITYRVATKINTLRFNNEKLNLKLQQQIEDEPTADSSKLMEEIIKASKDINNFTIAATIEKITAPDGNVVTNYSQILDFISNVPKELFSQIETAITNTLSANKSFDDFDITCSNCQNHFNVPFSFDYSNFFVKGS